MSLPNFSVRRPVTVIMFFIGIMLIGFIALGRLPQELFPPITYPQLTIVTNYKDAAPEEIESLVTKTIEEVVGTVSGVKSLNSISREENSLIIAEFDWRTNMDFAALAVREKIDLIKPLLPRGCEDPIVMKFNPFEMPVLILNVTGGDNVYDMVELSKKLIKGEIEKLEGVASVSLAGGVEREILVEVDQGRLAASGIPIVTAVDALKKANLNYPAGTIKEAFYEYLIRTMGEFQKINEIGSLAISIEQEQEQQDAPEGLEELAPKRKEEYKRVFYIKDIASVKDTFKERTSISRYNSKDNISLSVQKKAGANTVGVANAVKKALKNIAENIPSDVKISIIYDQSKFIKESITGVADAGWQGALIIIITIYLFLKNFRSSFLVALNIPISILATFGFMYFMGISLNMISLGGLALGIGMLVDAGIVVAENIFRHQLLGKNPRDAAILGTEEVVSALWGSVLTTVAVFLPMIFVVGIAGQLFKELALTITISLFVSLAISLSLMPSIAAKMDLRKNKKLNENPDSVSGGKILKGAIRYLSRLLEFFLNKKIFAIILTAAIFAGGVFMLAKTNKEFLPKIDQGQFIIKVELPPGTRIEVTDRVIKKIEKTLSVLKEVKDVTINIGSSKEKEAGASVETLTSAQGRIIVDLLPLNKAMFGARQKPGFRIISSSDVVHQLQEKLKEVKLEGANIEYMLQESIFKSAFLASAPVAVEIKGFDLKKLEDITRSIEKGLSGIEGIYSIKDSIVLPSPETKVRVLKDRAANYNLSVSDIAITAQTGIKGYVATKFKEAGKEIDVRVALSKDDKNDFSKIRRLIVHSPLNIDVPLSEVCYLSIGKGPTEIRRADQQRTIVVSANVFNRPISVVFDDVNKMLKGIKAPPEFSVNLTGENEQMKESFQSLQFALILSILLVYMIMAAEFESLWQPFIIMFTVPLSLIGVAIALWMTHTSVSVMVILGIITLGGIVVDNGIVLIEFVNQLIREKGFATYEALIVASQTRLRPILMTAFSTAFGLVPLAMGLGEGAELQSPMAITVMGGLLFSTFLSLVIIPTLYLSFETVVGFFRPKQKIQPAEGETQQAGLPKDSEPRSTALQPWLPVERGELNDRQKAVLEYLKENKRITRFEYAKFFNTSIPTASRDLKELLSRGLLKGYGPFAKGRYYELS